MCIGDPIFPLISPLPVCFPITLLAPGRAGLFATTYQRHPRGLGRGSALVNPRPQQDLELPAVASAHSLGIPDSGRGARRSQGGGSQAKLAFLRAAVTQEPFWADLQPRVALVERGGSLWLNCSTNCPRPERGGLETSLRRNGTQRGLRWLARQLVDIREPETQPVCFFRCARRTLQARGLIRTFREFSAATLLLHYFPSLPGPAPWVKGSSPPDPTL